MNKSLMSLIAGATTLHPQKGNPGPQLNTKQKIDCTLTITRASRVCQKPSDSSAKEFYIKLESNLKAQLEQLQKQPPDTPVSVEMALVGDKRLREKR